MTGTVPIRAAVITVSDRSAAGERIDESGPAAADALLRAGFLVSTPVIVADDQDAIRQAIRRAIDGGARLVVCTGGTGIAPRDVTPEAVEAIISVRLEGVAEEIRRRGMATGAAGALLARPVAGVVRAPGLAPAIVVAGPGSVSAARDAAEIAASIAAHAIGQLDGDAAHHDSGDGHASHRTIDPALT